MSAIGAYAFCLGPYCIAIWKLTSGQVPAEAQNPSAERICVAGLMYIFGLVIMLGQDAQKFFVLQLRKGLITHGWNSTCRNSNYLGEILLYASFNVIAQCQLVWYLYATIWIVIFGLRI